MAHDQPEHLKKLIRTLDDARNDIYVHIDAKSAEILPEMFTGCTAHSGLYFIDRHNVTWGGESIILREMELFRRASEQGYAYYHLISGSDFPIRSQDSIHSFFDAHSGSEFIEFWDHPPHENDYRYRIRYRYPLQEKIGRYTCDLPTLLLRVRSKLNVIGQMLQGVDRVRDYGKEIKCGANWVSITDAFVHYLLEHEKEIREFFTQGVAADELYKQTICWNSPFRDRVWPGGHMRLIDWNRDNPYTWQECDFDEIVQSDALFVRKVTDRNRLPDMLLERILAK